MMNFDPQKFFIGLMDFFSILLPGALLTYALMDKVGPDVLGERYCQLMGVAAWAAFLFASYLFGHLVFLLGSWLDELYGWLQSYTLNAQIKLLAQRGRLLPWLVRALIHLVSKDERNHALKRVGLIKQQVLGKLQAQDTINNFQWSKAWLNIESPVSLALVERFEADSKFFRCFAMVLLILLVTWPWHQLWPLEGVPLLLILLVLALWRFMERRFKATQQAYWSVITLTAKNGQITFDKPAHPLADPAYIGGIVYRQRGGQAEYLLVENESDPSRRELPKAQPEYQEHPRESAVRGVYETAGAWARIVEDVGDISEADKGKAHYYLMQAVGQGRRKNKNRQHEWLLLRDAIQQTNDLQTRELLQRAEQRRVRSFTDRDG